MLTRTGSSLTESERGQPCQPELQRPGQMLRLALKRVVGAGAATQRQARGVVSSFSAAVNLSAVLCSGLAVTQMEEHGANAMR